MGYYVDMRCDDVIIPKKNIAKALKAINGMFTPERLKREARGGSSTGEKWYSWVKNPPEGGFPDLATALSAWSFETSVLDSGDLALDYFSGEKLGQEDLMLQEIAPYVDEGGFIECRGEDNAIWRWYFDGKKIIEQTGTVTYA